MPPGIFSTLAYLLTSISTFPYSSVIQIFFTAFEAKSTIKLPHLLENFVPIVLLTTFFTSSSLTSILTYIKKFEKIKYFAAFLFEFIYLLQLHCIS
jgi:hypothetical protein